MRFILISTTTFQLVVIGEKRLECSTSPAERAHRPGLYGRGASGGNGATRARGDMHFLAAYEVSSAEITKEKPRPAVLFAYLRTPARTFAVFFVPSAGIPFAFFRENRRLSRRLYPRHGEVPVNPRYSDGGYAAFSS